MTDPLAELERLHEAAVKRSSPRWIASGAREDGTAQVYSPSLGPLRQVVTICETSEGDAPLIAEVYCALPDLLKQARLAATLTSILCTDEGQDVVERAKALVRFDKPRAAVGGEYAEGTIAELAQRCEVLIAEEQEKPLPDNALISVLCNTVRLTRECERFPPMGVVEELSAALAAKDATIDEMLEVFSTNPEEYRADPVGAMRGIEKHLCDARAELARMKERVAAQRDTTAERILFALCIYPNYRLDSRGPAGILLGLLNEARPDISSELDNGSTAGELHEKHFSEKP